MLDCAVNVSEGRRSDVVGVIAAAAGDSLLDVHSDPDHNRTVLTLAGEAEMVEEAARNVSAAAVRLVDLAGHQGVHPRLGAVDVVPFAPLPWTGEKLDDAVGARDRFARWVGDRLGLPAFLYGPDRSLPEVRRGAFRDLTPDTGPNRAHPSAGAVAAGARDLLVAYNLWIATGSLEAGRRVAASVRSPQVRALAFDVAGGIQVSCNLVDPERVGPADVYDRVSEMATVTRTELVGLVPASVLSRIPRARWRSLDLDPGRTIEERLATTRNARRSPR